MDKCAAAGGSPMRLDGLQTDRAALGGIQAAGSFGRMMDEDGTWRHHGACVEAKQSREGGVGVRSKYGDLDGFAPPMGMYLSYMH